MSRANSSQTCGQQSSLLLVPDLIIRHVMSSITDRPSLKHLALPVNNSRSAVGRQVVVQTAPLHQAVNPPETTYIYAPCVVAGKDHQTSGNIFAFKGKDRGIFVGSARSTVCCLGNMPCDSAQCA